MAKISGILTDGAGQIINDCTIELYAKKTTSKVLTQTQAFKVANNGSYSMNVLPCEYDVSLIINGFPKKRLGTIQVFSDSLDGTLNDFLLNPSESEITPLILQQVVDARNEAKQAATKAETSEKNSKTSETNASKSAKDAETSANNAKNSETNVVTTAELIDNSIDTVNNLIQTAETRVKDAEASASNATKSADSAKKSAKQSEDSAQAVSQYATNAGDSAKLAKESENNSKTSETNAAQSAKDAQKWASTVDNSNFIQKTGEENQSIDGSLDVKKLTENGVRVYSPNNKPSTDDIGALAATKTIVNGKTEYQTDNLLNFKVRPKFNNSDLISKSDFSVKLGNPGFEIMPSGLIRQWGVVTLPAVGNYHSVKIDSITYYTNYYRILLPIAFPTRGDSVNVTFNCGTFNNQYTMFGLSATANLDGSPTSFTVAVLSSVLGYVPTIHYEIIGH